MIKDLFMQLRYQAGRQWCVTYFFCSVFLWN